MKRHINYTRRKKIPKSNVHVILNRDNDRITRFDAKVSLQGLELPFDAKVFIEAYYRTDRKRFDFGTVSNITQPEDTDLTDLGNLENLSFRLKVVDITIKNGLILAEADKIKPHSEEGDDETMLSILATEFNCDLQHQIWRINFLSSPPILELNKNIPSIRSLAKTDPIFFFYVFPQVIREILTYMYFVESFDPEESTEEWQLNWFQFAHRIYPETSPGRLDQSNSDTRQDIVDWINNVVNEFALSEHKKWDQFEKLLEEASIK